MFLQRKCSVRKELPWIIVLSVIVLLPNFYLAFYGSDLSGSFAKVFIFLVISVLLFLLPSLVLKARTFFLFQGIFVLLAPIELTHIYMNRMPVTPGFLLAVLNTDRGEFSELFFSVQIPVVFYLLLCIGYFYIALKKIDNTYFITSVPGRLSVLGIFVLAMLAGYCFYFVRNSRLIPGKDRVVHKTNEYFLMKFRKIYPYDLLIITNETCTLKKEIREGQAAVRDFRFHAFKEEVSGQREVYVVVIGESARYSSFSINGYTRETTPLLSECKNLISFSDFFSEANYTNLSLPIILTRSTALDNTRHFREKSFVDAFSEAGFATYWIGNQSAGESFIRRIARDTDGEFFFTTEHDSKDNYDENLWPAFDRILARNDDKVLIVIHTLGSHFRYNFRYPESFRKFNPSFEGAFDYALISPKNKELFVNTYDNSILYTDFFLANTINKIDSLHCVSSLLYVSDHGQNLYDTEQNIIFHGGTVYTRYDFHVPFLVWTSDRYNQLYADKAENMQKNKDEKLSAGNIFYSILDIAGISFPEQELTKSVASGSLQAEPVRYIIDPHMKVQQVNW